MTIPISRLDPRRREPFQVFARAATYGLILWCCLSTPSAAQPSCSPTFEGEHGDALREQVVLPASCTPTVISLNAADDTMIVELTRDGRRIARRVQSAASAAAWVESWLMPEFEIPEDEDGDPPVDPETNTAAGDAPSSAPLLWTWATMLRGSIDTDACGWTGLETAVGRHFGSVHFSGAAHFELVPGRDTFSAGLTARVGVVFSRHRFRWESSLGLGLRVVSAPHPRNNPMMPQKFQLHTIPYGEIRSDVGVALVGQLSVLFGVDARFAFTSSLARVQFTGRLGLMVGF